MGRPQRKKQAQPKKTAVRVKKVSSTMAPIFFKSETQERKNLSQQKLQDRRKLKTAT